MLEKLLTYVLLCWESASMKSLVVKNLIAHKQRNKLTAIIYALTLGCIIFLVVASHVMASGVEQLSNIAGA